MTRDEFNNLLDYIKEITINSKWANKVYFCGRCVTDYITNKERIHEPELVIEEPYGGIGFSAYFATKLKIFTQANPFYDYQNGASTVKVEKFNCTIHFSCTRKELYNYSHLSTNNILGTLYEDMAQREISVHSIFFNVCSGELVDLFRVGQNDIDSKTIRALGSDASRAFHEDPIRMMHVIKYADEYGWGIEKNTWFDIAKNAKRLSVVKDDLIKQEINYMLLGNYPHRSISRLVGSGLMNYIFPELSELAEKNEDAYKHTLKVLSHTENRLMVRIAALFMLIGAVKKSESSFISQLYCSNSCSEEKVSSELAKRVLRKYGYSEQLINTVCTMIEGYTQFKRFKKGRIPAARAIKKFQRTNGFCLKESLMLIHAENLSCDGDEYLPNQVELIEKQIENIKEEDETRDATMGMPINGKDIMKALGIGGSPKIGEYMSAARHFFKKNIQATKDDILDYIKEYSQNI